MVIVLLWGQDESRLGSITLESMFGVMVSYGEAIFLVSDLFASVSYWGKRLHVDICPEL